MKFELSGKKRYIIIIFLLAKTLVGAPCKLNLLVKSHCAHR